MDHIRLGFDQIVLEKSPYEYREEIFEILHNFVNWCHKYGLDIVFNMHKALEEILRNTKIRTLK
jgi:hypothetical protein